MSDFPSFNVPKIQEPEAYEQVRGLIPDLHVEAWDDRLPVVFKKYRGMYPEYVNRFVEVLGKRKKKLKIRYAPSMHWNRGWNCDKEVREWVFFGGEEEFEGARNLVFYFVFEVSKECGPSLHRGRMYFDKRVYKELVNVETGRVFHVRVR